MQALPKLAPTSLACHYKAREKAKAPLCACPELPKFYSDKTLLSRKVMILNFSTF